MNTDSLTYALLYAAGIIGLFYLVLFLLKKWARSKTRFFPHIVQTHLHVPGLIMCISIIANIILEPLRLHLSPHVIEVTRHVLRIGLIMAVSFFITKIIRVIYELLIHYYTGRKAVDYSLRKAKTKLQMIQRILKLLIIFCAIIAILMTFPEVRRFGNTLLASAGVAGIILGFAAQKSLGTLFSGIQIAIAQPVKIDDVVVVDGQFGTIGEITLTYIVVNTWDEKRLIVPINYFLENSFENWTRVSPEVVGKVKIYTDYNLPIAHIRGKFNEWLQETELWDRRKSALIITGSNETTMEVRATMSADNSDDAFDLECLIREKLITYIRENYPMALPFQRVRYQETLPEETMTKKDKV
jgi:small-conductance mechanosensitive channel